MAWLLDTNVVSELRKVAGGKADAGVAAWQQAVLRRDMFISAVTLMELEMGVLQMERRDRAQGLVLRRWLNELVVPEFRDRTLGFGAAEALACARLHVPDPRSWRDSVIAASALVHGMTVVTRNSRDFTGTGVAVLDPWTGAHG